MTDETQQSGVENGGAPDQLSEIENNLMQFLDPTYSAPTTVEEESSGEPPVESEAKAESESPVIQTPPAPSNAPVVEKVAEGETDPNLLAQFFTTEKPGQQPAVTPQAQPAQDQQPVTEEKPWMPFTAPVELPPQVAAALFESDDPQIRAQALGIVVNSIGNAITQLVEQRFKETYLPQFQQQTISKVNADAAVQRVDQDFYGAFPQLTAHRDIVRRAFEIVAKAEPTATYSPEIRTKVGNLALKALTQMGVQLQAQTPVQQPVTKPAAKKQPFIAGNARPANFSPPTGTTPDSLFDELSAF